MCRKEGSCYKNCSEDPVLLHLLVLARGSFYMASIVFAAVCNNCGSMAVDELLFCWGPHAGLHVAGAWPGTTILQGGSCRGRQWKGDSSKGSRSKILKESGDNAGTISIVMTGSIAEVAIRTPNMWSKFLCARGWKKVNRRKDGDDILKRRKGALFSKPLLVLLSTSATRSGVEFNDGLQWIMASSEKTVSERTAQIENSDFQCLIYHCWKNVPSVNV